MPTKDASGAAIAPLVTEIAREAMEITCEACGVRLYDMHAPGRKRARVAFARQLAMYLCHVVGQLSMGDISLAFGRDRTTVGYACHIIEDRRDSPLFDGQVDYLEIEMRERMNMLLARLERRHFMSGRVVTERTIRRARAGLMR